MAAIETSPNKQVLFMRLNEPHDRDALVYDPPNEKGQTAADDRHDVIDATMSSHAPTAQISDVHEKLSLRDREAYWLYRQLESHFVRAPLVEVAELREEFEPPNKEGLGIQEKLEMMSDLLCDENMFPASKYRELVTRFHWVVDDAMKLCADVIEAANEPNLESDSGENVDLQDRL